MAWWQVTSWNPRVRAVKKFCDFYDLPQHTLPPGQGRHAASQKQTLRSVDGVFQREG